MQTEMLTHKWTIVKPEKKKDAAMIDRLTIVTDQQLPG